MRSNSRYQLIISITNVGTKTSVMLFKVLKTEGNSMKEAMKAHVIGM